MSSRTPRRDTRETILRAARRLLETDGANATLEQVAIAAGVSRQAVYLHFGSRTKLLLALGSFLGESQRMPERSKKALAATSAVAGLDAMIELQTKFNAHIAVVANALDTARRSDSSAAAAWEDRMETRRLSARLFVQRLAKEGRLRAGLSVDEATDVLWTLLSVRFWEDLVVARGWSRARFARRIRQLVHDAILEPVGEK